jgi:hypothetical protein
MSLVLEIADWRNAQEFAFITSLEFSIKIQRRLLFAQYAHRRIRHKGGLAIFPINADISHVKVKDEQYFASDLYCSDVKSPFATREADI